MVHEDNKNKELMALIRLLDEPDTDIYSRIRDKIFCYGLDAIPLLEGAWESSFDGLIQERIEGIIHTIQLDNLYAELGIWAQQGGNDLLKGYILISKFQYPDLNAENIMRHIGRISQDVWLELNQNLTALEKVKVMNHILYDICGFTGNKLNINAPENYYLNVMLESKKGNPISLGALYIIIAQSLGMPVYGVDLPRHFVLAYLEGNLRENSLEEDRKVIFYINPFNKGALFTRNEIELYIKQMTLKDQVRYYVGCRNKVIIRRMMEELANQYKNSGNPEKALELTRLLMALD